MDLRSLLNRIVDMSEDKGRFLTKNDGNAEQIRENLIKVLFIDDELNYNHWKQELVTHFINMRKTKINNDNKSNTKREKCLIQLLLTEPYGKDDEDFVYNSSVLANCVFADETIEYNSLKLKEELTRIKEYVIGFIKDMITLQNNSDEAFIRSVIYKYIDDLTDIVRVKFKR